MENERKRIPILIDTDLGDDVDDAAALLVVLNSPELDLRGITTVYKDTAKRAEMVKDLLKHLNEKSHHHKRTNLYISPVQILCNIYKNVQDLYFPNLRPAKFFHLLF